MRERKKKREIDRKLEWKIDILRERERKGDKKECKGDIGKEREK